MHRSLTDTRIGVLIGVLSFVFTWWYHSVNIAALRAEAPGRLSSYETIKTPDDNAYLAPALNYYHDGVWKEHGAGVQRYFLRTPGYGLFRYALMLGFGEAQQFEVVRWFQTLLFALSAVVLFQIFLWMGMPVWWAIGGSLFFGCSPLFSAFVNYNMTEAITPALVIFLVGWALRPQQPWWWMIPGVAVMAMLLLTRPILGVLLPVFFAGCWRQFMHHKELKTLTALGLAVLPLVIWEVRNTHIAGNFPGLHPIYHPQSNSMYRSTHEALWNFEKSFGADVTDFHEAVNALWMKDDSMALWRSCPDWVRASVGEARLQRVFAAYRTSIAMQRRLFPEGTAMPDTIPYYEKAVAAEISFITTTLWKKQPLRCGMVVPIINLKRIMVHSNLSLYMFQHTYRGRWWMEVLRAFFVIIHLGCFAGMFGLIWWRRKERDVWWVAAVSAVSYLLFLALVFRAIEERYMLPLLSIGFIGLCWMLWRVTVAGRPRG
ncbi:MAG: hypothetical protein U0T84_06340 [Chitinophagales bacterium]